MLKNNGIIPTLLMLTTVVSMYVSDLFAGIEITTNQLSTTIKPDSLAEFLIQVKNTGANPVYIYGIKKDVDPFPAGWSSAICVGANCYPSRTTRSPLQIVSAGTSLEFQLHINAGADAAIGRTQFSIQDSATTETLWTETLTCSNGPKIEQAITTQVGTSRGNLQNFLISSSGAGTIITFTAPHNDYLKSLQLINLSGKVIAILPFTSGGPQKYTAALDKAASASDFSGKGLFCIIAKTSGQKSIVYPIILQQ